MTIPKAVFHPVSYGFHMRFASLSQWRLLVLALMTGWLITLAPVASSADINGMRAAQQRELTELRARYDQRARQQIPKNPDGSINTNSPEYKSLHQRYDAEVKTVRGSYIDQDPRAGLIDNATGDAFGGKIQNTGSVPADVRADVDLAAQDVKSATKLTDQWASKGDKIIYHTIEHPHGTPDKPKDMSRVYKVVNDTWDAVVWTPETPEIRAAKLQDPDTFTTQGGQHRTGNLDAAYDPRGYHLDNEQKFLHAIEDADFKTVAKSVSKAGEATGLRAQNPDFYDQAHNIRKYGDPVQSGISKLGDTPDVENQKIQDWINNKAVPQMHQADQIATARSQVVDANRAQMAEQFRQAGDTEMADKIESMRRSVTDSNASADARNSTMREGIMDKPTAVTDGAGGTRVGDVDASGKPIAPDAPGGKTSVLEAAGTVMTGMDIMNTGQDIVDYSQGNKSGAEVVENAAINFTAPGQAFAAGRTLGERARDAINAWPAVDEANRSQLQAHATESGLSARSSGATADEAMEIMEALRNGDQAAAEALAQGLRDRGVDYDLPSQPETYRTEGDDTLGERVGQVAGGIKDQAVRAGGFVAGIPGNIRDAGVAAVETFGANVQTVNEEERNIGMAVAIRERLIADGVDPDKAQEAADAFRLGNNGPFRAAREEIQDRKRRGEEAANMSPDELANQLLAAADEQSGTEFLGPEADRFADDFRSADRTSQSNSPEDMVISDRLNDVEVQDLEQVLEQRRDEERAADQMRQDRMDSIRERGVSVWDSQIDAIDGALAAHDQQAAQELAQRIQEGQDRINTASAAPSSMMSGQDFGSQMSTLQQEQDRLQQEQTQILMNPSRGGTNQGAGNQGGNQQAGAGGIGGGKPQNHCLYDFSTSNYSMFSCKCPGHKFTPSKGGCVPDPNAKPTTQGQGGQYGGTAIAAVASGGDQSGFDQRQVQCNAVVKSGGNAPASITVDTGGFPGAAAFSFDHYGVKDRIAVIVGGQVAFDSGCVGYKGGSQINMPNYGQVKVVVEPNCAKTSSTAWRFSLACPGQVGQK